MSKPISLFSGYSQKENRVTNYVLLILRILYEESPNYLSEVLNELLPDDVSNIVGVSFNQQVKKLSSIPDGVISQKALSIYVETKNYDWFYDSQLEKHLEALNKEDSGAKVLIVLGNFEADIESRFDSIRTANKEKYSNSIYFEAVTFENFLNALNALTLSKILQDAVTELEYFFDEQNLLPKRKGLLDVVNCSGSYNELTEHGVYLCPTRGAAYSHKRCKYFGAYRKKEVTLVADIRAVIDIELDGENHIAWCNVDTSPDLLVKEASELVENLRPESRSTRVFLLGERYNTKFIKDTRGGMQQSKLYFNVSSLETEDANQLASMLENKNWSEFR